ncbi:hypothetical protein AVEN_115880-1, partial [Araneus ventricosus]
MGLCKKWEEAIGTANSLDEGFETSQILRDETRPHLNETNWTKL